MKSYILPAALILGLISCDSSEPLPVDDALPVRLIYLNPNGEQSAVVTFTYDSQNRLVREYQLGTNQTPGEASETNYKYDSQGNLINKITGNGAGRFDSNTDYEYKNGLLASVTLTYSTPEYGVRTMYYYTGNLLDSTLLFSYPSMELNVYSRASVYKYDGKKRLIRKDNEVYTYDLANRITSTCYGPDYCSENEYNNDGKISKVYTRNGSERWLTTEYIYKEGRLTETRNYSWFYKSNPTGPDIYVSKYEY